MRELFIGMILGFAFIQCWKKLIGDTPLALILGILSTLAFIWGFNIV